MKRRVFRVGIVVVIGMVGALTGLRQLVRSHTVQLFGRIIARVDTPERVVALTFDDGPTPSKVDEILRVLAERRVRATFFVIGPELTTAPEAGRRLVAAGHPGQPHLLPRTWC